MNSLKIHHGDNLPIMKEMLPESFSLVYTDPPFNTGKKQRLGNMAFSDAFGKDFLAMLKPRIIETKRLLSPSGSLFLHLDCREVHYTKVLLDTIFGRQSFMNEIIWAYDYGGRSKKRWSAKHDNILWYVKDPKNYTFNYEEMDRIPYMAPGLVGPKKAARGKTPTDVWWHTIVPTQGKERTGYPTQKPLGIIERIVRVHSNPGDVLLDPFAGSGTLGDAAVRNGRGAVLIDSNPEAISTMKKRFSQMALEST